MERDRHGAFVAVVDHLLDQSHEGLRCLGFGEPVEEALEPARTYLEDPATPPAGQLYLGTHFALWLLHQSRAKEAFRWLDRVRETSPTHRLAAHAHYWTALQAFRAGRHQIAERSARLARQCLSPKPGLHWEWTLDARAALLLRRLSSRPDSIDTRQFTIAMLTQEADGLDYDLRLLP